jgi:hypothetical protein
MSSIHHHIKQVVQTVDIQSSRGGVRAETRKNTKKQRFDFNWLLSSDDFLTTV